MFQYIQSFVQMVSQVSNVAHGHLVKIAIAFIYIFIDYELILFQMKQLVVRTVSWRTINGLLPSLRKSLLRRMLHDKPKCLSEMFQKMTDIPKQGEITSVSHRVSVW